MCVRPMACSTDLAAIAKGAASSARFPAKCSMEPTTRTGSLTVVGTGVKAASHATLEAVSYIRAAEKLLFLVADPITAEWLAELNPTAESLHSMYEAGRIRREIYSGMVDLILGHVRAGRRVCAALYGHPGIFAVPGHEAISRARSEGFPAVMLPGISAEDCLFADLGVDPARHGCQSFEATDFLLSQRTIDPRLLAHPLADWAPRSGRLPHSLCHRRLADSCRALNKDIRSFAPRDHLRGRLISSLHACHTAGRIATSQRGKNWPVHHHLRAAYWRRGNRSRTCRPPILSCFEMNVIVRTRCGSVAHYAASKSSLVGTSIPA